MEMPTWSFLVIAIIMAVVIGRAGTLLREHLNRVNLSKDKSQRERRGPVSQTEKCLNHLFH
ncbi:hypothetical protein L1Z50_06510 [Acinetobacter baumannii]|nr:hypothetical protein [Acinetobacter baumannii]